MEGYRKQWRTEVNTATSEYDKEASAESDKKKKEVGQIKEEKEVEVKKLSGAKTNIQKLENNWLHSDCLIYYSR
ncbi:hypothetical protein [Ruminiclostridium cellobioparum]|uniref:hypothetical protein n=1 Tax=Ruminiclostridium cellobioparum TaxID=29355 RepID=UPI0004814CC3|nr:hypothetical protein [Ruminiclostridium cellobioparum]